MTGCKTVLDSTISSYFGNRIKKSIAERNVKPTLVGFLANNDPASKKYAKWTAKSCKETGVEFDLKQLAKSDLERSIKDANLDRNVNGIMVYYPVFGNPLDIYLQNQVHQLKDVEGLGNTAMQSLYHNKRYMDSDKKTMKSIIPCTPLAIVKILEYLGEYKTSRPFGQRLKNRHVTIINRSEIVGRPLAALLANEDAIVYSVDVNSVQVFIMRKGHHRCKVADTDIKCEQALPKSDIVITGVPSNNYSVPTKLLKRGVVAINFSTFSNFEADVTSKASYYVPSIGKVTVAMLEKNLLRLHNYQQAKQ